MHSQTPDVTMAGASEGAVVTTASLPAVRSGAEECVTGMAVDDAAGTAADTAAPRSDSEAPGARATPLAGCAGGPEAGDVEMQVCHDDDAQLPARPTCAAVVATPSVAMLAARMGAAAAAGTL